MNGQPIGSGNDGDHSRAREGAERLRQGMQRKAAFWDTVAQARVAAGEANRNRRWASRARAPFDHKAALRARRLAALEAEAAANRTAGIGMSTVRKGER